MCFEQNGNPTHVITNPINPGHIFTKIKIRTVFAPCCIGRTHIGFTVQRHGNGFVVTITQARRRSRSWIDKCRSHEHCRHHLPTYLEGLKVFTQQLPDPRQNHGTTNRPKYPHLHAKLKDAVHASNITLGHHHFGQCRDAKHGQDHHNRKNRLERNRRQASV